MNISYVNQFLDRFNPFNRNFIPQISATQKKVVIFAAALFSLFSLYWVCKSFLATHTSDTIQQSEKEHETTQLSKDIISTHKDFQSPSISTPKMVTSPLILLNNSPEELSNTVSTDNAISPNIPHENVPMRVELQPKYSSPLRIAKPTSAKRTPTPLSRASTDPATPLNTCLQPEPSPSPQLLKSMQPETPDVENAVEENSEISPPKTPPTEGHEESFQELWQKAELCRFDGDLDESEEYYEKALKTRPEAALDLSLMGYGEVLLLLANLLTEAEHYDQAAAKYQKALAINPNDSFAIEGYAGFLLDGEPEEQQQAKILLEKVLKTCPSEKALELFIECTDTLGASKEDDQLIAKTKQFIKQANNRIILPSSFKYTPYQEGKYLLQRSEFFLATRKFKEAMKNNLSDDFAKWGYVETLLKLANHFSEQQIHLPVTLLYSKKCLEMIPDHPHALKMYDALLEIAKEYYEKKGLELKQKLMRFEASLRVNSENQALWWKYGNALMKNGEYEEAMHAFNKMLSLYPKNKEAPLMIREIHQILDPIKF